MKWWNLMELKGALDYINEPHEVVAFAYDKEAGVVYAAVQRPDNGRVYAAAGHVYDTPDILDGDEFDDETTGFGSDMRNCPFQILSLLSPTTNTYALDWRRTACAKEFHVYFWFSRDKVQAILPATTTVDEWFHRCKP